MLHELTTCFCFPVSSIFIARIMKNKNNHSSLNSRSLIISKKFVFQKIHWKVMLTFCPTYPNAFCVVLIQSKKTNIHDKWLCGRTSWEKNFICFDLIKNFVLWNFDIFLKKKVLLVWMFVSKSNVEKKWKSKTMLFAWMQKLLPHFIEVPFQRDTFRIQSNIQNGTSCENSHQLQATFKKLHLLVMEIDIDILLAN